MKNLVLIVLALAVLLAIGLFVNGRHSSNDSTSFPPKNEKQVVTTTILPEARDIGSEHSHFFNVPDSIEELLETNKFGKMHLLVGTVDEKMYKTIIDIPIRDANLIVISSGGRTDFGSKIAQLIYEERHNVVVFGICSSACAEFILPAAHKIYFEKLPLVGFHGNTLGYDSLITEMSNGKTQYCPQTIGHKERLLKIYNERNLNPDFWKKQYEHLIIEKKELKIHTVQLEEKYKNVVVNGKTLQKHYDNCGTVKVTTKHKMWYPTSKQLREDFGLKFTGEVCADYYDCYSTRLNKIGKDGDSYAVGDTVFIVNRSGKKP